MNEEFDEFLKKVLNFDFNKYSVVSSDLNNFRIFEIRNTDITTYFRIENDKLYGSINGKDFIDLKSPKFIKKHKLWKRQMKLKSLKNL